MYSGIGGSGFESGSSNDSGVKESDNTKFDSGESADSSARFESDASGNSGTQRFESGEDRIEFESETESSGEYKLEEDDKADHSSGNAYLNLEKNDQDGFSDAKSGGSGIEINKRTDEQTGSSDKGRNEEGNRYMRLEEGRETAENSGEKDNKPAEEDNVYMHLEEHRASETKESEEKSAEADDNKYMQLEQQYPSGIRESEEKPAEEDENKYMHLEEERQVSEKSGETEEKPAEKENRYMDLEKQSASEKTESKKEGSKEEDNVYMHLEEHRASETKESEESSISIEKGNERNETEKETGELPEKQEQNGESVKEEETSGKPESGDEIKDNLQEEQKTETEQNPESFEGKNTEAEDGEKEELKETKDSDELPENGEKKQESEESGMDTFDQLDRFDEQLTPEEVAQINEADEKYHEALSKYNQYYANELAKGRSISEINRDSESFLLGQNLADCSFQKQIADEKPESDSFVGIQSWKTNDGERISDAEAIGRIQGLARYHMENMGLNDDTQKAVLDDLEEKLRMQDKESESRGLGDHGIRHIYGNFERSTHIMEELRKQNPGMANDETCLGLLVAQVYHDTGYMENPNNKGVLQMTKEDRELQEGAGDHGRISSGIFENNSLYDDVFSKEVKEQVADAISTHNERFYSSESNIIKKALHLSDKTALAEREKLPDIILDDPKLMKSMTIMREYTEALKKADPEQQKFGRNSLLNRYHDELFRYVELKYGTDKEYVDRMKEAIDRVQGSDVLSKEGSYDERMAQAVAKDIGLESAKFNTGMNYIYTPADCISPDGDGIRISLYLIQYENGNDPLEESRQIDKLFGDLGIDSAYHDDGSVISVGYQDLTIVIERKSVEEINEIEKANGYEGTNDLKETQEAIRSGKEISRKMVDRINTFMKKDELDDEDRDFLEDSLILSATKNLWR